ncbi:MAG: UDP-3-O-acyl-N-acetylglucosamine deacetylase [Candidatus Aminicenantes bacterium]|nr:UDP-3-O-acyl-N-acetylglucosamine deacetylase [Candidatus Aminicenantes bacterium]MDH5385765.1 UDP-3-O-acyl-N-acetylglucosamine deacetylase [Candidatus Aminicenantes bacterium]MDH5741929.1 UDP-3-O-acyl-N-acetylglucosamine deacetylase [Candidatus Aminicenantes bacterium]
MVAKKTIKKEIVVAGVGIHTGRPVELRLRPSDSGKIIFRRTDLDEFECSLDPRQVESKNCTMFVSKKGKILTLEHLLAVLWVYGIDSLIVELNGEEIPIMDGSALHFVHAVHQAGIRDLPQRKSSIKITQRFLIQENDASISAAPDSELKVTYHIHFEHPCIKHQKLSISVNPENFKREIAPARTFGFLKEVPDLHAQGLAIGGSLKNAVVLDETRVVNGPLRFPDEFVRHKILDFIGDLSLMGSPVTGHFIAKKAGHALHLKMIHFLLDHAEYWAG